MEHPGAITDLETAQVPTAELRLYEGNARQGDVGAITESLRRLGQYRAIVVNRGTLTGRPLEVLAGNHTVQAARAIGWATITAHLVDVDDDTARRIVLVDNRTNDLATNDTAALLELLQHLEGDYSGTGYDGDAVDELLEAVRLSAVAGEVHEDDPGPAPEEPVTRLGDVWVLGEHRLACGDATRPEVLDALLAGDVADLLWTDPPYGVSYEAKAGTIANDDLPDSELELFLSDLLTLAHERIRKGGASFVCAPSTDLFDVFATVLRRIGVRRHTIVWVKDRFVLGRADYHYRHESIFAGTVGGEGDELEASPIAYGWVGGAAHLAPPNRRQDTVWNVPRPSRSADHPTMKPVELPARAIRNHTREGDLVLDVCAGSGSVVSACEQLGRRARMVELDERYCDVIVRRWEALTGREAQRLPAEIPAA